MNERFLKLISIKRIKTIAFNQLNNDDVDFLKAKLPLLRNENNLKYVKYVKKISDKTNYNIKFCVGMKYADRKPFFFKREMTDFEKRKTDYDIQHFNSISRPPIKDPKEKPQTDPRKPKRTR